MTPSPSTEANSPDKRRDELLARGWPTSIDVGTRAGCLDANKGLWTKDRRDAGQLLGVWDKDASTFRYPDFQFDDGGRIRAKVAEFLIALALVPERTAEEDTNGWRRAYWLFQPRRSLSRRVLAFRSEDLPTEAEAAAIYLLNYTIPTPEETAARTPAEVFGEAPDAVIALARADAAEAGF